jgi:hypothetical protein
MSKGRIVIISLVSLALLALLSWAAWSTLGNLLLGSKVILVNKSSQVIDTVEVVVAGKTLTAEDIGPGGEHNWRNKPGQDSAFVVSGRFANGETFGPISVGYTTPGDNLNHTLVIHDDGSVTYDLEGAD